jgi:hypothetical protein
MAVRLSALHVGCALPPERFSGTHFCWRLSQPQGDTVVGRIRYGMCVHLLGSCLEENPTKNLFTVVHLP